MGHPASRFGWSPPDEQRSIPATAAALRWHSSPGPRGALGFAARLRVSGSVAGNAPDIISQAKISAYAQDKRGKDRRSCNST
jgi:hypothetical protein